jgi:uncharacterized membrane protein
LALLLVNIFISNKLSPWHIEILLIGLINIIVSAILNYFLTKYWIFKNE